MPEDYDHDFGRLIARCTKVELQVALAEIFVDYQKHVQVLPALGPVEDYPLDLRAHEAVMFLVSDTGLPTNFICSMIILHQNRMLQDEDNIRSTGYYIEPVSDYIIRKRRSLN